MLRKTQLKRKTPLRAKKSIREYCAEASSGKSAEKKPRSTNYVADMDRVFQYYIRLRDAMPGGYTRCISCGKIKPFDQMQAGHFFSRSHFSTRWDEDNVNSECTWDNCWNGEHLLTYKENLIRKIGMQRFNMLEIRCKQTRNWSNFEIVAMVRHYGKLIMQISSSKGIHVASDVLQIVRRYQRMKP